MSRRVFPCLRFARYWGLFLLLAALLPALSGCGGGSAVALIERDGTVRLVPLEGGFYGIVGDDNVKYEPTSLTATFQQDGLRVHFIAKSVSGASIHQWGMPIEITSIIKL